MHSAGVCSGRAGAGGVCGGRAAPAASNPSPGGEAGRAPARAGAGAPRAGKGRGRGKRVGERRPPVRGEEAGNSARPAPGSSPAGCRWSSRRWRFPQPPSPSPPPLQGPLSPPRGRRPGAPGARGPGRRGRSSPAVPRLRLRASPMAEGRRREDEEEELRERREVGGPRRARGRALSGHPAADRNERNKPEHRSSSQGPLSSIRAVIKRSSRTSIQSEVHRDRRRPEITIVAAEPLRPASWFPGAPPPGLGFPPTPATSPWRPNELVPAELPPSYEQVIKEINQVQVNTTNNNNAAATPRHTITSATQTDFSEDIDNDLPQTLPAPLKPLQPSPATSPCDLPTNVAPLIVFDVSEEPSCPENPTATRCPVPKPRSKSNLRPVAKTQQKISPAAPEEGPSPGPPQRLLDGTGDLESQARMHTMSTEQSQTSIVSRIKAFEGQTSAESSGLPKKPEITPRTLPPKPAVSSGKPSVAPKPAANRASGEWDSWTESRLKATSREGSPFSSQEPGSVPVTKPELPKKPTPGLIRSVNHEIPGGGPLADNPDAGKKVPTPAPRPLLPKKSISSENPACSSAPPKPAPAPPRLSVASQAKAFRSLGEGPAASPPVPALQSKSLGDIDLISFDDDVLPASPGSLAEESIGSEVVLDPFQLPTKTEPTKERTLQPATARKPTVIRIPSKPGKCLHEDPQSPPPLPAEKPIGNTYSTVPGKPSDVDRTRNLESNHAGETGGFIRGPPRLPPRPVNGKPTPARRPPPKGAPERPPPPKLSATRTSSKKLPFNRSSSDMDLQKKQSHLASGLSKTKSQVFKNQDPVLPPRPKPGHPLYRKYMLSVPHGIANEDIVPQNPGELTCKDPLSLAQKPVDSGAPHAVILHDFAAEQADDLNLTSGEIVYLLEKIDTDWYRGKCRNQTGVFPANYVKVIVDIPEGENGKRESVSSHCVKGTRCVARFEYIGDQKDELSFSEGEIIILKEYVNEEWARGELRDRTGIFPLNFVELVEDHSTSGANVLSTKVPPKTKKEDSGSRSQGDRLSGEWCRALHSFTAETGEDLSFTRGDRILILERLDSDWCRGRLRDREGIFPAAFVQPCPAEAKSTSAISLKGRKAKALYDFQGENEDELSFKAGDVITELESVDDDWMSGELMGKSGIFPKTYVQILQAS
ncbi:SH3 domain-containing protein 19 isoform X2 [Sciurus carolinensis]|uniref:SH3 domain-containing protein 19 isoform X2 n=1 Tax=Sciurus carolinensis TaxID=30640 RepID=UPI001FB4509A|nr:SH3 domain-containing protein 19 isoform X2 [Sciurus carolinensis]